VYPADLPLRQDLTSAHTAAWKQISAPGEFFTGAQRVAIVAEARRSKACAFCGARKDALTPFAVSGSHDAATDLPGHIVEFVHFLRTDPGRMTRAVYDAVIDAGLSQPAYVELVSVITTSVIIDTLHQSLGLELPQTLPAASGEPGRTSNPDVVDGGAWVPISAAAQDVSETGLPTVPNIARALGLVPAAMQLFFTAFRPHYALKDIPLSISQAQAEFVASRVSALNECFY
jgi:hypothetical protein